MDTKEFYQKLKEQLDSGKPFVAYRKPGDQSKTIRALIQNSKEVKTTSDFKESGFVFAPFNPEQNAYLIPTNDAKSLEVKDEEALEADSELYEHLSSGFGNEQLEEDQKYHENLVQKGIDAINNGEFKKVVLARSEKVAVYDPDAIRVFRKLLKRYEQAFVYLWYHPHTGCWLGATPETLLKTRRHQFETMALAGTQVYNKNEETLWGTKEVEEQQIVTDYIINNLQETNGISDLEISKPYTAKAGSLLHIRTDIRGKLQDTNQLSNLIRTLHPTPAICGLPKEKALAFILENEDTHREFYSGFLGEINFRREIKRNSNRKNQENQQFKAISLSTELYVNLRCMRMKEGAARIFVGGGITKDSNAADEWTETVNKSQTMKAVLVK